MLLRRPISISSAIIISITYHLALASLRKYNCFMVFALASSIESARFPAYDLKFFDFIA